MWKDRFKALNSLVLADGLTRDTGGRRENAGQCCLGSFTGRDALCSLLLRERKVSHDEEDRLTNDVF